MPRYVAFLRAVNVGGRYVQMARLRSALESAGFADVQTHIQSGNIHVQTAMRSAPKVAAAIEDVLGGAAGFTIPAIVRTPAQVRALVEAVDGIPALHPEGGRRYVALASGPVPEGPAAALSSWNEPGERVRVLGADVLAELTTPAHSVKLTNARLERITGLTTTWRDLKVVRDIDQKWGTT